MAILTRKGQSFPFNKWERLCCHCRVSPLPKGFLVTIAFIAFQFSDGNEQHSTLYKSEL